MLLKYLGEGGNALPASLKCAVAVSVPCDLRGSAVKLTRRSNLIYMARFIRYMRRKLKLKSKAHLAPDGFDFDRLNRLRNFPEWDAVVTARLHGFKDVEDYWEQSASIRYLDGIQIPTLLITAQDDPFFSTSCYPVAQAERSRHFWLESPRHGGHVGFVSSAGNGEYWQEQRISAFLQEHVGQKLEVAACLSVS
jgi:predicted alpha/beta-fold hydrolase